MRFTTAHRPLAVGIALLLASGCLGLDTGPGLRLIQSIVGEGEALAEFSRASGGTSTVAVTGQIVGKLPCDEVRGEIDESGSQLELTITVVADRQFCSGPSPTTHSYVANILNLDAGDRGIRVRYRYQGTDGVNGVVLDTVVVVGG